LKERGNLKRSLFFLTFIMAATRPLYLRTCIFCCIVLSDIAAGIHYSIFKIGLLNLSSLIINAPGGPFKNLKGIWFVRFFRRCVSLLVRTPLRNDVLQLIAFDPDSIVPGSVIVSCHTPWARLLTQWCVENDYAMIVGWGPWTRRTSIATHATGFNDLRVLAKHLRSGGRIIIMADIFNDLTNCPVKFFEKSCNASLFPLRLAEIASTSLVTVIPALENKTVQIHTGPRVSLSNETDPEKIMQTLLSYFEKEIKQNPSVWSDYIKGSLSKEL
jgi:hypothetical protein